MVVAGDAAPDVAWLGGVAFGLDRQVADDADALAGRGVLKGDPGWPHGVDLADGWAVLPCNRAAGPAEEDVGDRGPLAGGGALVDTPAHAPAAATSSSDAGGVSCRRLGAAGLAASADPPTRPRASAGPVAGPVIASLFMSPALTR